jgi:hypothetical protein
MYKLRWMAVAAYALTAVCTGQDLSAVVDRDNAIYQVGEPIRFRLQVKGPGADQVKEASYVRPRRNPSNRAWSPRW